MVDRPRSYRDVADLGASAVREGVKGEDVGQVGLGALGLAGGVRGGKPRGRLAGCEDAQRPCGGVVGRTRVVAPVHGERGEVAAVVGVQVGEHDRRKRPRIEVALEGAERAVAEVQREGDIACPDEVARGG
jgi:hypothetical protein